MSIQRFPVVWCVVMILPTIYTFKCNSISDSTGCASLAGCTWDGTTCTGTFTPVCPTTTCYYIDPVYGSDTGAGSVLDPFKTFTPGFTALQGISGKLVVINPSKNLEVQLLSHATITSDIIIGCLFYHNKYILSLQNFDITSIPLTTQAAISVSSGKTTIYQCVINRKAVRTGVSIIFEVGDANLNFESVVVTDSQTAVILVNIISTKTTAQFSYLNGNYDNAAFSFNLTNGVNTFTNVNFMNNLVQNNLIYAAGTLTMTNIIVNQGSSLFVKLAAGTTAVFENLTMSEYPHNFLSASSPFSVSVLDSTFKDCLVQDSLPFIQISGTNNVYFGPGYHIKNTIFSNMTVKNSLIIMEKDQITGLLDTVTMTNIKKQTIDLASMTSTDVEYQSQWFGGVCFLARGDISVTFQNSNFTNIYSHCLGFTSSALTVTSCLFDNSGITDVDSSIPDDDGDSYSGVSWINFDQGTSKIWPGLSVVITSSTFNENKLYPNRGGAMRITGTNLVILFLTDNMYVANRAYNGGAIYSENSLLVLEIVGSTFINNTATNGGAIYKTAQAISGLACGYNVITQSQFTSNKATSKGGAIYLNIGPLSLMSSTFTSNQAQNGGAIYYFATGGFCLDYSNQFSDSKFISNIASNSGGALKVLFDVSNIEDDPDNPTEYTDNIDFKGLAISDGAPSYYNLSFYDIAKGKQVKSTDSLEKWVQNSSLTSLNCTYSTTSFSEDFQLIHKSGHEINQIMMVEVIDSAGNIADYITDESFSLMVSATQNNISDFQAFVPSSPITFEFKTGRAYMKSAIKIIGQPTTTATLRLTGIDQSSNILNDVQLLINQDVQVYFINCEVGDIYNSQTRICETCEPGTYSLANPYVGGVCEKCNDETTVCLGGSLIAPRPGYWRYDPQTAKVLSCPESDACMGGYFDETYDAFGLCAYPYEGNLCNKCMENYAKFGNSPSCINCDTDTLYYVKFFVLFFVQVVIILYSVKCNITKQATEKKAIKEENRNLIDELENQDFQSNLIKIAVNFLQISTIIMQYQFQWPAFISKIIEVTNKIIPNNKDGFSIDCILTLVLKNNELVYFFKVVIVLIEPFAIWLCLILLYIFYLKVKKETVKGNPKLKKNVVVLFIITAFILQPNIYQTTLELFKCRNFSSDLTPIYFMEAESQTRCWTKFHIFWSVAIALPNFLLWAVVLPLILLLRLRKNAKNLSNPEVYVKYSFVYEGLKTDKYFWEFVILSRKILVILIFVFLNLISVQSQAFATFLVILIYSFLHFIYWPYNDHRLNKAEMLALITLGIMMYSGMFFLSNGGNEWLNTTLVIISCGCNLAFYLYLTILFIKTYKKTAKHVTQKLKAIKTKIIEKRKTNRSNTISSNADKKKDSINDVRDLSAVLKNVDSPGSSNRVELESEKPNGEEETVKERRSNDEEQINSGEQQDVENPDNQDDRSIPSENDYKTGQILRSKTILKGNQIDIDIDNNSPINMSRSLIVRPSSERKLPSQSKVMMNQEKVGNSSNKIEQKDESAGQSPTKDPLVVRSFSVYEQNHGPIEKEDPKVNDLNKVERDEKDE